ncbi:MAG TPA: hypothetical protein VEH06_01020 [Candidatus Bathyarchaeia archaeon]|nr:hypothetical protein [Candidatus Bathyarchaeia archaeon]
MRKRYLTELPLFIKKWSRLIRHLVGFDWRYLVLFNKSLKSSAAGRIAVSRNKPD